MVVTDLEEFGGPHDAHMLGVELIQDPPDGPLIILLGHMKQGQQQMPALPESYTLQYRALHHT